jgi:hypothetical protein
MDIDEIYLSRGEITIGSRISFVVVKIYNTF